MTTVGLMQRIKKQCNNKAQNGKLHLPPELLQRGGLGAEGEPGAGDGAGRELGRRRAAQVRHHRLHHLLGPASGRSAELVTDAKPTASQTHCVETGAASMAFLNQRLHVSVQDIPARSRCAEVAPCQVQQ